MQQHKEDPDMGELLKLLEQKFQSDRQDIKAYLTGLLHSNYLKYWDYIHLDTLLSLQIPATDYPDERIFIGYHQITELYLRLILDEVDRVAFADKPTPEFFLERIRRINRYLSHMVTSFDIVADGMDKEEFLKFRTTLMPASGFQSVQFRKLEICSTDLENLVDPEIRNEMPFALSLEENFKNIYWRKGATESSTGLQTLTLKLFERKYADELLRLSKEREITNLNYLFKFINPQGEIRQTIVDELRRMDQLVNVDWVLAHYRSAVKHLSRHNKPIASTGGTNWQKYLPPHFQKRSFFPALWTAEEMENWGRQWVEQHA